MSGKQEIRVALVIHDVKGANSVTTNKHKNRAASKHVVSFTTENEVRHSSLKHGNSWKCNLPRRTKHCQLPKDIYSMKTLFTLPWAPAVTGTLGFSSFQMKCVQLEYSMEGSRKHDMKPSKGVKETAVLLKTRWLSTWQFLPLDHWIFVRFIIFACLCMYAYVSSGALCWTSTTKTQKMPVSNSGFTKAFPHQCLTTQHLGSNPQLCISFNTHPVCNNFSLQEGSTLLCSVTVFSQCLAKHLAYSS